MSEKRCKPPWLSFEARIEAVWDVSIFRAFFIFGAFIYFWDVYIFLGHFIRFQGRFKLQHV